MSGEAVETWERVDWSRTTPAPQTRRKLKATWLTWSDPLPDNQSCQMAAKRAVIMHVVLPRCFCFIYRGALLSPIFSHVSLDRIVRTVSSGKVKLSVVVRRVMVAINARTCFSGEWPLRNGIAIAPYMVGNLWETVASTTLIFVTEDNQRPLCTSKRSRLQGDWSRMRRRLELLHQLHVANVTHVSTSTPDTSWFLWSAHASQTAAMHT